MTALTPPIVISEIAHSPKTKFSYERDGVLLLVVEYLRGRPFIAPFAAPAPPPPVPAAVHRLDPLPERRLVGFRYSRLPSRFANIIRRSCDSTFHACPLPRDGTPLLVLGGSALPDIVPWSQKLVWWFQQRGFPWGTPDAMAVAN
jgi:hypothetical protein